MPVTPRAGIIFGSLTNEERRKLEEERERLYQQLDEKDEEINLRSHYTEKLKEQIDEQKELIRSTRRDYETLQQEMGRITQENASSKEKVKEVLQAFEELAVNYDTKCQEVETKNKENETLHEELSAKQNTLNVIQAELQLKDMSTHQNQRITEMLINLLKDLSEMGVSSGNETDLEISEYEKELAECRQRISQYEAGMKSLQGSIRAAENEKRTLEDNIDALREECAKMKAQEQVPAVSTKEKANNKLPAALERQLDQLRDIHYKQLAELRDEIGEKQSLVNELKDTSQKYMQAHQQLRQDYEKLKQGEAEKSAQLQKLLITNEKRERALKDLKGMEDTVAEELQTLNNLRELLVQDVQSPNKKSSNTEEAEDDGGSLAQKQKISFLENKLDQLNKVHKQLVRDYTDLRCEQPQLEKRLRTTMERVKALEAALKVAKEDAMRDRKRYHFEVDRIKEAARQRNLVRRGPSAQTAKPQSAPANIV